MISFTASRLDSIKTANEAEESITRPKVYRALVRRHAHYWLPSTAEGFRKVDVKLISTDDEKRTLIVPRGYYAGSNDVQSKPKEQKSQ